MKRGEIISSNFFWYASWSADVLTASYTWLFFTSRILRTDEDVGCLGQPLHKLSNALCVVLGLAQRAHHGAQHATDDACEQLWVEGFGSSRSVGHGVGPCRRSRSGTRGRWWWREDGLGLEMKWKLGVRICYQYFALIEMQWFL